MWGIQLLTFSSPDDENLSDDIEQLFELTRIMVLVLTGLVPSLDESKSAGTLYLLYQICEFSNMP